MIQGYLYQKMIEVKASMKRSKRTRVLRGLNLDMLTFIDNTTKNSISGSLSYKVIPKVILHSQKRFILFIKRFWFFSTKCICSNSYITSQSGIPKQNKIYFIQCPYCYLKLTKQRYQIERKYLYIIITIRLFWLSGFQSHDMPY